MGGIKLIYVSDMIEMFRQVYDVTIIMFCIIIVVTGINAIISKR